MSNRAEAGLKALALAAALLAPLAWSGPARSDPVTLVTPLVYGTHLPGLGTPALALAQAVAQGSNGAIVLDLKQPGDGTSPQEILDKVSDGKVDAGFSTASFWAAKVPAAALFAGFPFGPDAKGYLAWFDNGNGRKLYQETYDQAGLKVHVIPCAFGGAETGGWFAKEIKSKKDLEGLRMRIFGLGARVMAQLGVVPVLVPGGSVKAAFEQDKIDAAELYTPAVDHSQGLQEAVKLIYAPGWQQPATVLELLINKDRWAALGKDGQAVIENACSGLLHTTLTESAELQAKALASLTTTHAVRVLPWPDDVLPALREAWAEIARQEGVRDYVFKTVLEDLKAFQAGGAKAGGADAAAKASAPGARSTPAPTPTPSSDKQ